MTNQYPDELKIAHIIHTNQNQAPLTIARKVIEAMNNQKQIPANVTETIEKLRSQETIDLMGLEWATLERGMIIMLMDSCTPDEAREELEKEITYINQTLERWQKRHENMQTMKERLGIK